MAAVLPDLSVTMTQHRWACVLEPTLAFPLLSLFSSDGCVRGKAAGPDEACFAAYRLTPKGRGFSGVTLALRNVLGMAAAATV